MTLKVKPFNKNRRMEKMQNDISNPRPTKLLNSLIPADLFEEFKIAAIKNKKTMTDVLIEAITEYVKKNKSPV
jgi:ribbon-helix-helix protein